ncbi:MAG: EscV/YscV/HrcV family type III secretion system export apparatus protein [Verrucomicrobia bacterium CG1_02_43_26]|nr:MAG: EscV/YscV/HrcV family type III secretion system export apparatus protein [Verrucomicrobia bacterium CG1_02_43_26]
MAKIQDIILKSTRYTDVFLALLIVMIISLMIIPIHPAVMDALLALNMSIAATLIMIALYIPGILSFSTFPSVLLLTTLFRLALNISTTRLILLDAYAGEIINTFGHFVVAGNIIVGGVIFLIILIVQFIVITKGSERVAEVAARFTLDAMPGKQMSIDADMRAGVIDVDQARARRSILEKENQLYGAMDGAMKFVKGDAIAGLIITAINIVAGLSIGILQKGMTMAKAIQVYSILTIGDGLVSQIPALLISVTAGIIVTRVASDDKSALGADISKQLMGQPKALLVGGCLIAALSLIPGFPKLQFLTLSAIAIGLSLALGVWKKKKIAKSKSVLGSLQADTGGVATAEEGEEGAPASGAKEEFSLTIPLMLDVANSVQDVIDAESLNRQLIQIRKALYQDLGVPFPGIHLRFNENLIDGAYNVLLQEVPISEGYLKKGYVIAREDPVNLDILKIPYEQGIPFLPSIAPIWVSEKQVKNLEKADIAYMDAPQILSYHISFVLKKYAGDFLGIQEAKYLMEKMDAQYSEIVREVQRILPIQKIAEVFQRLVQEDISIRNMRSVTQSLIDWGQKEKDPVLLTEYSRSGLKRYISYKYSGGKNILAVYLLDPNVEETIRKAVRQTSGGNYLALDPKTAKKVVNAVKEEVGDLSKMTDKPVLLTSMDIRRYVRKLVEADLYELPVLSHQELTEEITVQPLGKINID